MFQSTLLFNPSACLTFTAASTVFLQADEAPPIGASSPPPAIRLEPFLSGLRNPVALTDDGSGRLFVVEQQGLVRLVEDGRMAEKPLLDISDRVDKNSIERGLKGLAFHPAFAANGRFFVNYARQTGRKREVVFSECKATGPESSPAPVLTQKKCCCRLNGRASFTVVATWLLVRTECFTSELEMGEVQTTPSSRGRN